MSHIPDRRSMRDHGPYSAYCKVCWNPVYALWIGSEPHGGVCPDGHKSASDCFDARNRSETAARIQRYRETGQ